MFGLSKDVVKECRIAQFVNKIDISRLIIHSKQIEEEKVKEMERENKMAKICCFYFSQ